MENLGLKIKSLLKEEDIMFEDGELFGSFRSFFFIFVPYILQGVRPFHILIGASMLFGEIIPKKKSTLSSKQLNLYGNIIHNVKILNFFF